MWAAPPCASYSRARGANGTARRLRGRAPDEVEGLPELTATERVYLILHNRLTRVACALARAHVEAGGTAVLENPVDAGFRRSPHFRWDAQDEVHVRHARAPGHWVER